MDTPVCLEITPSVTPQSEKTDGRGRLSYGRRRVLAVLVLLLAAVVADGSRREAADFTKPLVVRGDIRGTIEASPILRLQTFNMHSGKGADGRVDVSRTARVFEAPHVVGLNEVRGSFWPDTLPDQASQLGSLLGMQSVFVPTERRWWHDHFGNGLLTRLPLKQMHRIPLVGTRGKAFRCATLVQFEFRQRTINLLAVHVDSQSDREHQLRAVIALFLSLQEPAILMGDLNSTPDDPQLRDLLAQPSVVDALAAGSSSASPREHIDWIIVRGFRCRSRRLIETDASDHPAVSAELELLPARDE